MAEGLADAAAQVGAVLGRPQRQQRRRGRRDAHVGEAAIRSGNQIRARLAIGHQRDVAQPRILAEALVVAEYEQLVLLQGPSRATPNSSR